MSGAMVAVAVIFLIIGWLLHLAWDYFLDWLYDAGWVMGRWALNLLAVVGLCTVGWVAYTIAT